MVSACASAFTRGLAWRNWIPPRNGWTTSATWSTSGEVPELLRGADVCALSFLALEQYLPRVLHIFVRDFVTLASNAPATPAAVRGGSARVESQADGGEVVISDPTKVACTELLATHKSGTSNEFVVTSKGAGKGGVRAQLHTTLQRW